MSCCLFETKYRFWNNTGLSDEFDIGSKFQWNSNEDDDDDDNDDDDNDDDDNNVSFDA